MSGRRPSAAPWWLGPARVLPWVEIAWTAMEVFVDQAVSRLLILDLEAATIREPTARSTGPPPDAASEAGAAAPLPAATDPATASAIPPPGFDLAKRTDLDDDFVKLVGYSIVSVRRGRERHVKGGSQVIARRMTREAFTSWMIARNADSIEPGEEPYLRVHFTVANRWPREPLEFEERQLAELAGIRDALTWEVEAGDGSPEES